MQPLMHTDSELLLKQGIKTGVDTFARFLEESNWDRAAIDRTVCHQVGVAHRKLMLDSLGLSSENDFATFGFLGNTGAAALPSAFAIGCKEGFFGSGDKVAWLGIGSGINSTMMGIHWNESRVKGGNWD